MAPTPNKPLRRWERWALRTGRYRPLMWLAFLTVSLILFWLLLPPFYRASLWTSLQSQGALAAAVILFSLLTLSLLWSVGQKIDDWGFALLNMRGDRPRWMDLLMVAFTQIGSGLVAIFIALFFYFYQQRRLAYELMLGVISLWLVVELLKALVQRPRPFFKVAQVRMVGYRDRGRSFPSGHTSQAFFLGALLAHRLPVGPLEIALFYGVALLVGLTRMYVGAHYPRDVLAGAILGSAWGLMLGVIR